MQMQVYMRKMGLAAALYLSVNKNNDELYGEILELNTELADQFLDRGEKLVWMDQPPKKLNESAGFYKCRFCNHRPVCHLNAIPDRNCRTCKYSKPVEGGKWICFFNEEGFIDTQMQQLGCSEYESRL